MAGFRFPGPLGDGLSTSIDVGTLARTLTPSPDFFRPADHAERWLRQKVRHGTAVIVRTVGALAYEVVLKELRALGDDIRAQADYISRLPAEWRDQLAYDVFASAFEHYLPRKFLRQYIWGRGQGIELTLQEMIDCNPIIDLNASTPFVKRLEKLRTEAAATRAPVTYPFTLEMVAGAATNGTLGQFTVRFQGEIVMQPDGSWLAQGWMHFEDTWDFDPRDADTGGRSAQGEAKTRFADKLLPGTPFAITTPTTEFQQTQADPLVVWAGGTPTAVPDKVSKADLAVGKADQ